MRIIADIWITSITILSNTDLLASQMIGNIHHFENSSRKVIIRLIGMWFLPDDEWSEVSGRTLAYGDHLK